MSFQALLNLKNGTLRIGHNSDGNQRLNASAAWRESGWGELGNSNVSGSYQLPKIVKIGGGIGGGNPPSPKPKPPSNPLTISITQSLPTQFSFRRGVSGSQGSPITSYTYQISTSNNFASNSIIRQWNEGTNVELLTQRDLIPRTRYYVRHRANSSAGSSAWSATVSVELPGVNPPTISAKAREDGKVIELRVTKPDALPRVDSYEVIHTTYENGIAYKDLSTVNTPNTQPFLITSVPGTKNTLQVKAIFRGYKTEVSNAVTLTTPSLDIGIGKYFDGSTPGSDGISYSWQGEPHNSLSKATRPSVLNWILTGDERLIRSQTTRFSQNYSGEIAANGRIRGPQISAGTYIGSKFEPGSTYYGYILVNPTKEGLYARAYFSVFSEEQYYGKAFKISPGVWSIIPISGRATKTSGTFGVQFLSYNPDTTNSTQNLPSVLRDDDRIYIDSAIITLGESYEYFDGETRHIPGFRGEWEGGANNSSSILVKIPETAKKDPLADPKCAVIPKAPIPPAYKNNCLEEILNWRRFWVNIPKDEIGVWSATLPTIEIRTGTKSIRQARIRFFANPDSLTADEYRPKKWESETIISYLPANTTLRLDGITERAVAQTDEDKETDNWRPADHLLYGTDGVPATWPELSCGVPYLAAVDVPEGTPNDFTTTFTLTRRY